MVKTMLITAAAVCCLACASAQAASGDAETAKFSYESYGDDVVISLDGTLNKDERAANVIFAAYDSGKLIAVDQIGINEGETTFEMPLWHRMKLPYSADRVSVKAFLWTADGNCTPMSDASELVDTDPTPDESGAGGIVVGIRPSTASELPMVSIVTDSGFPAVYPVDDMTEADKFYQILTGTYGTQGAPSYNGETITKDDMDNSRVGELMVSYSVTDEALTLDEKKETVGGVLEYNADTMSLGEYKIDENSVLIDIDMYLTQGADFAGVLTTANLVDGCEYSVYLCDQDSETGVYSYAVINSATGVQALTPVAVVKEMPEKVTIDGTEYLFVPVAVNNVEDEWIFCRDTDIVLSEGDIIFYSDNNDRIAKNVYKAVDMRGLEVYDDLLKTAMAAADDTGYFSSVINNVVLPDPSNSLFFGSTDNDETKIYFGPVYCKNGDVIQLITGAEPMEIDGASYLASDLYGEDIKEFWLDTNTNVYLYDYSYRYGKGMRVIAGHIGGIRETIYHGCETDDGKLLWNGDGAHDTVESMDCAPFFAFVKTVDGDVTDVMFYMTP